MIFLALMAIAAGMLFGLSPKFRPLSAACLNPAPSANSISQPPPGVKSGSMRDVDPKT
jgi:hypothetical protein